MFFGRFDTLKGIDLFLDTMDIVAKSAKSSLLKTVTFLGLARYAKLNNMDPVEYVKFRSLEWRFDTQVITDKDRNYYLQYMRNNPELMVVFPSRIENSPTVVMESAANDVCFLASDVGGTAELLTAQSRKTNLFVRDKHVRSG